MNNINVLFRKSKDTEDEFGVCSKHIQTYTQRTEIPSNSITIGRYSVLPFYKELELDLKYNNSALINSFCEHDFIASFSWYWELDEIRKYTFNTYLEPDIPFLKDGEYVVKGCTNSIKHKWNTHMYCANKAQIPYKILNLRQDSLIESQDIIIRKYEKLKTFEYGINGQPFTNEWRFFYYKTTMLSYAYYWTTLSDIKKPYITNSAIDLANEISKYVSKYTNFYVLDLAETESGEWKLIEINDGQMSGLSYNNADTVYKNLTMAIIQNSEGYK